MWPQDEDFWRDIREAFTLDRTIVNLNNGGVCPSPRVVHEALKRYLDISNQAPVYHMWQVLEPNLETVRRRLAAEFGCDAEELAVTRNASEALQIAQLGIDLKAGDEVLTTNQDYPRMLDTWQQRVRREGIVLKQISFPVPPADQADLLRRFEQAVTPRTKVIHVCHITNLTGQIFPVRDICRMARARGIRSDRRRRARLRAFPVHARGPRVRLLRHEPAQVAAGAGRHRVPVRAAAAHQGPLAADAGQRVAGRRHQEVRGDRHPSGGDAQRHRGGARVPSFNWRRPQGGAAALPAKPVGEAALERDAGAKVLTSFDPAQGCAIGLLSLAGLDPEKVTAHLWNRQRIIVTPIKHAEFQGLRITPNLYTTLGEIDAFVGAIDDVLKNGIS